MDRVISVTGDCCQNVNLQIYTNIRFGRKSIVFFRRKTKGLGQTPQDMIRKMISCPTDCVVGVISEPVRSFRFLPEKCRLRPPVLLLYRSMYNGASYTSYFHEHKSLKLHELVTSSTSEETGGNFRAAMLFIRSRI